MENNYQSEEKKTNIRDDENFLISETQNNFQTGLDNIYNRKNEKKNSVSPKLVFGVLIFLAVGTLVFGFVSLTSRVYNNKFQGVENNSKTTIDTEKQDLVNNLLDLQASDTDKDGLSDYDEMYIYKTSPYLADTDSDGYLDKEEIDTKHDPLCPSGQDCRGAQVSEKQENNSQDVLPYDKNLLNQNGSPTSTVVSEIPADLIKELENLNTDQIRELLRSSGQMTEEQLNQIDNETLMRIYKEALGTE